MKLYFYERMQTMINRSVMPKERQESENYLLKLSSSIKKDSAAKAVGSMPQLPLNPASGPQVPSSSALPLVSQEPSKFAILNQLDPKRAIEVRRLHRAAEYKLNQTLQNERETSTKSIEKMMNDHRNKNEENDTSVKQQLMSQNDKIQARLNERRQNSISRSLNRSTANAGLERSLISEAALTRPRPKKDSDDDCLKGPILPTSSIFSPADDFLTKSITNSQTNPLNTNTAEPVQNPVDLGRESAAVPVSETTQAEEDCKEKSDTKSGLLKASNQHTKSRVELHSPHSKVNK